MSKRLFHRISAFWVLFTLCFSFSGCYTVFYPAQIPAGTWKSDELTFIADGKTVSIGTLIVCENSYEVRLSYRGGEGFLFDNEKLYPPSTSPYPCDNANETASIWHFKSHAYKKVKTVMTFEVDRDYLSEREGTPSYVGKTITLKKQS